MKKKGKVAYFKSDKKIRNLCRKNKIDESKEIIIYCFKGSRASNTYMALKLAGFNKVRVYFASWNEWGRYPGLPIEK
jgi:thiosulfate/3-mercaptopyruvate sulfurtransferase